MENLNSINAKINKLKQDLVSMDYILRGSIKTVYNRCGKKECICHRDENKRHGPYHLFTKKVKGKTTGRHYSQEEASLLKPYLKKYNRAVEIIRQISELSDKAVEIILNKQKPIIYKNKKKTTAEKTK